MSPLSVNLYLAATFLILSTRVDATSLGAKHARIIGGEESNVGEYTFSAAIYVQTNDSKFFCGGSLLNHDWIITSGNCVYNAVLFTIQLGSVYLNGENGNRQTVATSDYVLHPQFNPDTIENDIGLIKLRMSITFTQYIQPIYFPTNDLQDGQSVTSVGWGQTSDYDSELSNYLSYVSTSVLSNAECRIFYGNQITDNMVCVEGNYNEGICNGDNGSPLIEPYMNRYHMLGGIASFISGNGCESTDPSGYTRTFPYNEWIRNVTKTVI
jgi:secreted trypsin-like serine protease